MPVIQKTQSGFYSIGECSIMEILTQNRRLNINRNQVLLDSPNIYAWHHADYCYQKTKLSHLRCLGRNDFHSEYREFT